MELIFRTLLPRLVSLKVFGALGRPDSLRTGKSVRKEAMVAAEVIDISVRDC